jgi:hypothetical protein
MWRVSTILRLNGLSPELPEFTDETRDRGKAVHAANEALSEGFQPADEAQYQGYIDGLRQWYREYTPHVVASERRIVNRIQRLTGRIDLHALVPFGAQGRRSPTVIDVKTGTGEAAWHGIQLAGYASLSAEDGALWGLFCQLDQNLIVRDAYQRHVLLKRAVLYLPGDGTFKWREKADPEYSYLFRAALGLTGWRYDHGYLQYTDAENPNDDAPPPALVEQEAF